MKKWIVLGAIALAGGAWALLNWRNLEPAASRAENSLANRPTTAVVETRSIQFKVSAAGEIGPAEQVSVRPEINGRIKTLDVDLGDRVKKGDVLFTLDDSDLQIEKQSRETEIDGAKLQLEKAERNYQRAKELYEAELISKELYEDTKTEFELAKNSLERAQKNLNLLEDRLKKTRVEAPFDCTVLTRPVSVGQAVSGSGGFNSGTEVLTIADLNNMIVNAHVNQADVTRLSVGQEVGIAVESVPGLNLKGVVERLAPQSTIKNSIKGYPARVRIHEKEIDPRVRPGMTANLSIPVASSENAVAVPLAAVFTEQGERFVLVKKSEEDNTFERRPVQLGIADYDYAEVLSGLRSGEVVSLEDKGFRTAPGLSGGRNDGIAGVRSSDGSGDSGRRSGAPAGLQKPGSTGANEPRRQSPAGAGSAPRPGGTGTGGVRPTTSTAFGR
ncbi:MAG: efflux RND transporter periplasmic adaptor subunit [Verrucomicrobia bacterium]|nr:efflux RND transporter periplasmic adaptor subunit [Verrucomicrobiota bacterium]